MSSDPGAELADYFAALLRVPRAQVSTVANVLDLGADSIMLLEARGWIESRYGRRIEIRRFFEDLNTIEAIAGFLEGARVDDPAGAAAGPPVAAAPVPSGIGQPGVAGARFQLMRSQLALVADVIEAQNRVAASLCRRSEGPPVPPAGLATGGRPGDPSAFQETEVPAA